MGNNIVDFSVIQKWNRIPANIQQKILENVWCGKCLDAVEVIDYTMTNDKLGVIIEGACKNCGGQVVRILEEN